METLKAWMAAERGRSTALALKLEITQGALSQWKAVPATHVAKVSAITGIPIAELRPDLAAIFAPVKRKREPQTAVA